ncbi:MATE family efflux transporter [Roseobacter denitrificans]|uniref:DNA-damage-inducible protein, putative n=1 Tax=Roseobacter denitrificans (strain ATCC 33942 / OCh 114) TaxID=375451 RepID=Q161C7_ROSDO|nr:MATE family efflux transporter [Roseobacter denitrificans]ABG33416.1 DNA-damage-inducible protein, putative [Roseobacter denitrificans OCh 114]AVL52736.1 MATE family efflux transporter [Roseobacter denitrificans]SFG24155.1 multidrug resistance protein, MATE family [Roseobacter denitrificans OCh 114]
MTADPAAALREEISHRRVLKIALPIVLSNATVPILGAVDVGVVGQMGEAAPIGAVALGAVILSTMYWIFGFLRMGTVGLVGQAEGAGDRAEVSAWLTRALVVALVGGFLMIVMQPLIFWSAFRLAPASDEVEGLARQYLAIRIWTAPAAIAVFALTGWLVAMEKTAGVFWVQLVMNGVNIVLDLVFVLVLDWGVPGVAAATVIAEITGCALALWFCRAAFQRPDWRDWPRIFDRAKLIRMALLNTDIFLRSLMLMIIFSSFVFIGARFGDVTLAANQVLIQFMYITVYAMDGFAFTAESLIARAYGLGKRSHVRRSVIVTSFWGLVVCVTSALAFALAGGWIIDVMAKDPDVQQAARAFLPYMVAAPVVGCAAWMLDGIFIGATRGRDMRNMMALSFASYWLAILVLLPIWGNHGLWVALLISFAVRGITLGARYPALERHASKAG